MDNNLRDELLLAKTFSDFINIIIKENISKKDLQNDIEIIEHFDYLKSLIPPFPIECYTEEHYKKNKKFVN